LPTLNARLPADGSCAPTAPQIPAWKSSHFTEYPFTGTSVILPLTPENGYTMEVVYFGGQAGYAW
jgi:hypothetical protein